MKKEELKKLKKITEIISVSGKEDNIIEFIEEEVKFLNLNFERTNLGSLNVFLNPIDKNKKTILIDSHVDEVGFIVKDINDNGLINFEIIGGIQKEILAFKNVLIENVDKKIIKGLIIQKKFNTHNNKEKNNKIDVEDLFIDIGASTKKEVINELKIKKGNQIVFDSKTNIRDEIIMGKSFDNRLGVFIALKLMKKLNVERINDFNIIFGFSTQEEVGLRGARGVLNNHKIDLAFVLDISPAKNKDEEEEPFGIIGKGPILRHKDAYTVYQKDVIEFLENIMLKNKIEFQNYISFGGTNAGIIEILKEGVKVIPIGMVARNLHTNCSIANINDIETTYKLLELIFLNLNKEYFSKIIV